MPAPKAPKNPTYRINDEGVTEYEATTADFNGSIPALAKDYIKTVLDAGIAYEARNEGRHITVRFNGPDGIKDAYNAWIVKAEDAPAATAEKPAVKKPARPSRKAALEKLVEATAVEEIVPEEPEIQE